MDNLQIRQGENLPLTITSDDVTADTIRFLAKKENEVAIIDEQESFTTVDGKRVAIFDITDTNKTPGTYRYMLTITYLDGSVKKLPDASNCEEGDCDFPELIICEALDLEVS